MNHSKKGYAHERKIIKKMGWTGVPGSGNKAHDKEDAKSHYNYRLDDENVLIQIKYTSKTYYILKLSDLKTLKHNALLEDRDYLLHLTMIDSSFLIEPYFGSSVDLESECKSIKLYLTDLDKKLIDNDNYTISLDGNKFSIRKEN